MPHEYEIPEIQTLSKKISKHRTPAAAISEMMDNFAANTQISTL